MKTLLSSKDLIWYKTKLHIEKNYLIVTPYQNFLCNGIDKEVTILVGSMDFRGVYPQDPRRQLKRQPEKLLEFYIKSFPSLYGLPAAELDFSTTFSTLSPSPGFRALFTSWDIIHYLSTSVQELTGIPLESTKVKLNKDKCHKIHPLYV